MTCEDDRLMFLESSLLDTMIKWMCGVIEWINSTIDQSLEPKQAVVKQTPVQLFCLFVFVFIIILFTSAVVT